MAKSLTNKTSNVPNEAVLRHRREVSDSKRFLQEAQGHYRATLKRAKSEGINTRALIEVIETRKQEPETVAAHYRDVFRYATIEQAPFVSQLDLLEPMTDTAVSRKAQTEDDEWKAADAGYLAGRNGHDLKDNPHQIGSSLGSVWLAGYQRGQATIAEEMGEDAEVATATPRDRGRREQQPAA